MQELVNYGYKSSIMDFSIKGTPVRIETENEFVDAIAYANLKRGSDIWTQDIVPWTVQVELGKGQEAYPYI